MYFAISFSSLIGLGLGIRSITSQPPPPPVIFTEEIFPVTNVFPDMHFGDVLAMTDKDIAVRSLSKVVPSDKNATESSIILYHLDTIGNNTGWVKTSKLTAPQKPQGINFASAFDFLQQDGETKYLIVGSGSSDKRPPDGVVYVYAPAKPVWNLTQTIAPPAVYLDNSGLQVTFKHFGSSIAILGDIVAIAAANEAIFLFDANSSDPASVLQWRSASSFFTPSANIGFGKAIALSSNHVAVGAPDDDGGIGSVYLTSSYGDDDDHDTLHGTKLAAPESALNMFGYQVHLTETCLAVSAVEVVSQFGVVYVSHLSELTGNGLVDLITMPKLYKPQKVTASDAQAGDGFGATITSAGADTLLIGAPNAGAVYVFKVNSRGIWKEVMKVASDTEATGFGASIAVINGLLAIGADRLYVTGAVLLDGASLAAAPSAPEEPSDSHGYGDSRYNYFDTVPHALVSTLIFIVLPSLALGTGIYCRKPLVDYIGSTRFRFQKLKEAASEDETEDLQQQRRVFVHDDDKRSRNKAPASAFDETHGFIRV